MKQTGWKWLPVCAALMTAPAVHGQEAPKRTPPAPAKTQQPMVLDAEFLEFLANWDSEDESWSEYLARNASVAKDKGTVEPAPVKKKVDDNE